MNDKEKDILKEFFNLEEDDVFREFFK